MFAKNTPPPPLVFADSLLRAEQMHLFRLLVWGGGSVLIGTLVFALLAWRRPATTMLRYFAIQMIGWGALEIAYVALAWQGLGLRDVSGATRLDRLLWLNLGLDLGLMVLGITVGAIGWRLGRRLALLGTGVGVLVQAMALFLINAQLAALISR